MYASHVITGACMQIQESIKEGGGGTVLVRIHLGGLGACCRNFCAMRELLVQTEALMQG